MTSDIKNSTVYSTDDVTAWWLTYWGPTARVVRIDYLKLTEDDFQRGGQVDPADLVVVNSWGAYRSLRQRLLATKILYLPRPGMFHRFHAAGTLLDSHFLSAQIDISEGFLPRAVAATPSGEPAIRIVRGRHAKVSR